MSQRLGKVTIKIGSRTIDSLPGAKLNFGGVSRKPVIGSNKVLGYSEIPVEATIDCSVSLGKGDSIRDLDFTDETVTFAADTGQVYSMANAWVVDPLEVTANDGGPVVLKIAGIRIEEIGV